MSWEILHYQRIFKPPGPKLPVLANRYVQESYPLENNPGNLTREVTVPVLRSPTEKIVGNVNIHVNSTSIMCHKRAFGDLIILVNAHQHRLSA